MMLIDMTAQLGSLLTGLDMLLVIAAAAIAVSMRHRQSALLTSRRIDTASKSAIVDASPSAPTPMGGVPSDTSIPQAA